MPSPRNNPDLHGNVQHRCSTALLLVDVINDLNFPDSAQFAERALVAAQRIHALKRRVKEAGVPIIYLNDNFGRWRSDMAAVVEHCTQADLPGRPISRLLAPEDGDYVVLKPKHSGFFATPLDTMLSYLGARALILAGFTADQCLLFTAADAFLRDYRLLVPADCTASVDPEDAAPALKLMQKRLHVDTREGSSIDLGSLIERDQ